MYKNKIITHTLLSLLLLLTPSNAKAQQLGQQNTMTFDSYLALVEKQNLSYLASRLNVPIADAELIAAKVFPDPTLEFEGNKETYTVGLSYTLGLGKRYAGVKLARTQSEWERLALEQEFHDLRAEAAEFFLEAILQRELVNVMDSSYQYMRQLSLSDSLRYIAGEITENDARQSRLESVSLLNTLFDQEANYHSAMLELNRFMGIDCDSLCVPIGDWNNLERNFVLGDLLTVGLANRADLKAAEKNSELCHRAYKSARVEKRPDIDLSLSYERDWNGAHPETNLVTIGVALPLTFSAINRGSVNAAKLRVNQARLMEHDIELQIQTEIRQAWTLYRAAQKKVAQYKTGVLDESQKVLEGMVFRYRRGEASIMDVLLAQRTYNEVQQDYLETMKEYVSTLVSLEKSCGIWDIYF